MAIPVITSNRINTPDTAEQVLADGCADMVSLARPFLADADFVAKAAAGRVDLYDAAAEIDTILGRQPVGQRVALIGAGGIGFDVAELLVHDSAQVSPSLDIAAWQREWGVTDPTQIRGGVTRAEPAPPARQVTLLQRKAGKLGAGLGKTTGWIHRAALKMKNVQMVSGVNYERIGQHDGALGLFVTHGARRTGGEVIACDTIVLCAGQEPLRELQAPLEAARVKVHLIGGAHEAGELDAKRAIDQGTRLAASL